MTNRKHEPRHTSEAKQTFNQLAAGLIITAGNPRPPLASAVINANNSSIAFKHECHVSDHFDINFLRVVNLDLSV